jgi:hypothetical protein
MAPILFYRQVHDISVILEKTPENEATPGQLTSVEIIWIVVPLMLLFVAISVFLVVFKQYVLTHFFMLFA